MPETKQVNVIIPKDLAIAAKVEAASHGVTLNEFGRLAFERLLAEKISIRRVIFDNSEKKILGRKLKV